MSQSHTVSLWSEPKGTAANPSVTPLVFKIVDGGYALVADPVPDAVAIDLGAGVYTIIEVTDPAYDPTAPAMRFVEMRGGDVGY